MSGLSPNTAPETGQKIIVETSRSGCQVLKKDGRFLASSIDPIREAFAWAERACVDLTVGDHLVVLGAGSGYHLAALRERIAADTIFVIEPDVELINAVCAIHPTFSSHEFVQETDWSKLVANAKFRVAVSAAYSVAFHAPSLHTERDYFAAVERLLSGRDRLSLLMLLKTRPELLALLSPESLARLPDGPMSIKTVQTLFGPQATGKRERRLWQVLEELVL